MKKLNAIIYTDIFCTVLHNAGYTKRGAERNARRFFKSWKKSDDHLKNENLVRIELRKPTPGSFDGELVATIKA
ncbi:MAG: hypothetical protein IJ341_10090 [Bacteroidales bacterium]|nr:hypothetical protein [Bacteroidales bacterium]